MTRYYSFAPNEMLFLYTGNAVEDVGTLIDLSSRFENVLLEILTSKEKDLINLIKEYFQSQEISQETYQPQTEIMLQATEFFSEVNDVEILERGLFHSLDVSSEDENQQHNNIVMFSSKQLSHGNSDRPFAIVRRQFSTEVVEYMNGSKWKSNDFVTFGLSLIFHRVLQLSQIEKWRPEIIKLAPDFPEIEELPVVVTPNWLFVGSDDTIPDQGTGGGPGTLPVPASLVGYGSVNVNDPNAPWSFNPGISGEDSVETVKGYANAVLEKLPNRNGAGPVVIVLDTAPPANAELRGRRKGVRTLDEAYARWSGNHPLLASLLEPGTARIEDEDKDADGNRRIRRVSYDKMSIWYADEYSYQGEIPSTYDPNEYDQKRICKSIPDANGHRYYHRAMDHGTFVAGIIHTLCPSADIHLVQVLNDYAHGNLMVLARQLFRILDHLKPNAPIIVNMSLTFDIPLEETHQLTPNWGSSPPNNDAQMQQERRKEIEDILINDEELRENLISVLRYLTESIVVAVGEDKHKKPIFEGNGRIVAAAGNDRKHPNHVPIARYPAAFNNVIGVASLRHDGNEAEYSNTADRPRWWGFSAVGGNQDDNHPGWSDSEHGLLGLYIGEFPRTRDENGNPVAIEETNDHEHTIPNRNGWARWSGTSFATPVVVGRLACLLSGGETADLGWAVKELQRRVDELEPTLPDKVNVTQGPAHPPSRI